MSGSRVDASTGNSATQIGASVAWESPSRKTQKTLLENQAALFPVVASCKVTYQGKPSDTLGKSLVKVGDGFYTDNIVNENFAYGMDVEEDGDGTTLAKGGRFTRVSNVDELCQTRLSEAWNEFKSMSQQEEWQDAMLTPDEHVLMVVKCIGVEGIPCFDGLLPISSDGTARAIGKGCLMLSRIERKDGNHTHRLHICMQQEEFTFDGTELFSRALAEAQGTAQYKSVRSIEARTFALKVHESVRSVQVAMEDTATLMVRFGGARGCFDELAKCCAAIRQCVLALLGLLAVCCTCGISSCCSGGGWQQSSYLKVDLEDAITRRHTSKNSKNYEFPDMEAPITGEEKQDFSIKQLRGISFSFEWRGEEKRMVAWVSPLESTPAVTKFASLLEAESSPVPFASNSKSNSSAAAGVQGFLQPGRSSCSCIKKNPVAITVLYAIFMVFLFVPQIEILRSVGSVGLIVTMLADIGLWVRGSKQSLISLTNRLVRRSR